MSASLVGSEMCIRDSRCALRDAGRAHRGADGSQEDRGRAGRPQLCRLAVHLVVHAQLSSRALRQASTAA
eukprot:7857741-Alexandrium_andersonii.AAC.1